MFDPLFALLFLAAVIFPLWAVIHWSSRKRRSSKKKGFFLIGAALLAAAVFVYYAGPDLFVTNDGAIELYVVVPEQKAVSFTNDLDVITKRLGMTTYINNAPFDGIPFYVLEGHGGWLRLWSQNIVLDGDLPVKECGSIHQSPLDPGQFSLMIFRILPFGTELAAKAFSSELASELRSKGYEVRSKPLTCSPWLKDWTRH